MLLQAREGVDTRSADEALLDQLRSGEVHPSLVTEPHEWPVESPAQAAA